MATEKAKTTTTQDSAISIITPNTKIEGKITVENDLRLEGSVEGDIIGNSKVVIGSEGLLKGTLSCKNAEINGRVLGSLIISEKLTVRENASIIGGDIKVKTLIVEPKAVINANCIMNSDVAVIEPEIEVEEIQIEEEEVIEAKKEEEEELEKELKKQVEKEKEDKEKEREQKWHSLI